jgi:hypothetical protein
MLFELCLEPPILSWPIITFFLFQVLFKMADYTYSGTRVDPQAIMVSTAPKVRCSVSMYYDVFFPTKITVPKYFNFALFILKFICKSCIIKLHSLF